MWPHPEYFLPENYHEVCLIDSKLHFSLFSSHFIQYCTQGATPQENCSKCEKITGIKSIES
jgi:hypothetical protein